jgi:HPt (histidine-containing phosphotransfer) domain-containing protein
VQLNYLNDISGGDSQFKHDLIVIFLRQMPEFISSMEKYLAELKLEELAKEAHTAKSSVLVFEMEETARTLKKIQNLAEADAIKEIDWLIKKVKLDFDNVKNKLSDIADSLK